MCAVVLGITQSGPFTHGVWALKLAALSPVRGLPESEPPCADPDSLRVRRFSRRSRTQTAACRCVTAARAPLTRGAWRTTLEE